MTNEEDLLLQLCRPTAHDLPDISGVMSSVHWNDFYDLATTHDVLPLVYHNLNVRGLDSAVPGEILRRMDLHHLLNTTRNEALKSEWIDLLRLFDANQVRVFPVKGVLLAETAYGSIALRVFSDLDFLVHPEDIVRCSSLLQGRDYRFCYAADPAFELWSRELRQEELVYQKPGPSAAPELLVELHRSLASRALSLNLSIEKLWSQSSKSSIAGITIFCMRPEEMLILLGVHAWKHAWTPLKLLVDITYFLEASAAETNSVGGQVDWTKLITEAKNARIDRILYYSLALAQKFLSAHIPAEIIKQLRPSGADIKFPDALPSPIADDLLSQHRFQIKYRTDLRDKLRLITSYLLPAETDYSFIKLPPKLFPLYFLIRPFLLGYKFLSSQFRLVRR